LGLIFAVFLEVPFLFFVLDASKHEQRERVFAGGKPVDHLLVVAADRGVRLGSTAPSFS
jgi:hypothetical protein